jgi:cytochrome P450
MASPATRHDIPELEVDEVEALAADADAFGKTLADAGRVVMVGGRYHITRRDDVVEALRSGDKFSASRGDHLLELCPVPVRGVPVSYDGPEHARYRKILQPYFSPHAVGEMASGVRELATATIDNVVERGEPDVVADAGAPVLASLPLRWGATPAIVGAGGG